jgi:hypothetical protein
MSENNITYNNISSASSLVLAMLMTTSYGGVTKPLEKSIPEPTINYNFSSINSSSETYLPNYHNSVYNIINPSYEIFKNFISEVVINTKDLDYEAVDFVNENFWDLL